MISGARTFRRLLVSDRLKTFLAALAIVLAEFDAKKTVLLEEPGPNLSAGDTEAPGTMRIDQYQPTRILLTTDTARAGWLVLSENYYPGWTVRIDDQPGKIYRADYVLRAVPLTSGTHHVEMTFELNSFIGGAIISVATLGALLLIGMMTWKLDQAGA